MSNLENMPKQEPKPVLKFLAQNFLIIISVIFSICLIIGSYKPIKEKFNQNEVPIIKPPVVNEKMSGCSFPNEKSKKRYKKKKSGKSRILKGNPSNENGQKKKEQNEE